MSDPALSFFEPVRLSHVAMHATVPRESRSFPSVERIIASDVPECTKCDSQEANGKKRQGCLAMQKPARKIFFLMLVLLYGFFWREEPIFQIQIEFYQYQLSFFLVNNIEFV